MPGDILGITPGDNPVDTSADTPVRHRPDDTALPAILALIRESFAYMDDRIDPPSSMHRLTLEAIRAQCDSGEVWSIGDPPRACVLLRLTDDALYLGKLSVAASARGQGLARRLVDLAALRAQTHGRDWLELETRIELIENHRLFAHLGFHQVAEGRHAGYARTTYIRMRRAVVTRPAR